MSYRYNLGIIFAVGVFSAACGGADQSVPASLTASPPAPVVAAAAPVMPVEHASAKLESKSGSTVTGTATFDQVANGVSITVDLAGAKPGKHGLHIHETGDCSAPDAKSAGGHYNPLGMTHGAPGPAAHHGGDLGNIEVGADGKGHLAMVAPGLYTVAGETSIMGKALVVHDGEDDLHSQPAGNSGSRVACGVIE